MKKKYSSFYISIAISLLVLAAILLSIRFLDEGIAVRVMQFIRSIRAIHKVTEHIPDILPDIVAVGTILMWLIYFYRLHKKLNDAKTHFLLLAAVTLPVSYILKTYFQFMFGRTTVRSWLLSHKPLRFEWFHGFGGASFPSGHMTVFAAFGAALLIYFPKLRKPVIIFLIVLGVALIGTDYHFLSDVIAGAYLGFATTYVLFYLFEKIKSKF